MPSLHSHRSLNDKLPLLEEIKQPAGLRVSSGIDQSNESPSVSPASAPKVIVPAKAQSASTSLAEAPSPAPKIITINSVKQQQLKSLQHYMREPQYIASSSTIPHVYGTMVLRNMYGLGKTLPCDGRVLTTLTRVLYDALANNTVSTRRSWDAVSSGLASLMSLDIPGLKDRYPLNKLAELCGIISPMSTDGRRTMAPDENLFLTWTIEANRNANYLMFLEKLTDFRLKLLGRDSTLNLLHRNVNKDKLHPEERRIIIECVEQFILDNGPGATIPVLEIANIVEDKLEDWWAGIKVGDVSCQIVVERIRWYVTRRNDLDYPRLRELAPLNLSITAESMTRSQATKLRVSTGPPDRNRSSGEEAVPKGRSRSTRSKKKTIELDFIVGEESEEDFDCNQSERETSSVSSEESDNDTSSDSMIDDLSRLRMSSVDKPTPRPEIARRQRSSSRLVTPSDTDQVTDDTPVIKHPLVIKVEPSLKHKLQDSEDERDMSEADNRRLSDLRQQIKAQQTKLQLDRLELQQLELE